MGTITITPTFTKIDVRKTFENFEADLRMIALRTDKMEDTRKENLIHDIHLFAEYAMIRTVDVTLVDENKKPIRAAKYTVNESGNTITGDRAGNNNDWPNQEKTELTVILTYTKAFADLTEEQKKEFLSSKGFKSNWVKSEMNLNYPDLKKESGQVYGNNGYELKKDNYKK